MKSLETLIPPPLIALIVAFILWGTSLLDLGYTLNIHALIRIVAIVLLMSVGIFFSIAGVISFKRAKTTVNPLKPHEASALVTQGIYQISRNPMYVGFCFLLTAFSIYLGTIFIILLLPVFIFYLTRFQIIPEERALKKLFGDAFVQYQSKVRRWL